ncbi:VirK/YbjX family protein [Paludibacterium yongneupense]|uniref:VirK/YbjX family protein n=1 Tax=Paludibacterium yongneupense TaxID=400061 RepID=UPI0003F973CB|nr:VirK/YbjX family protein [Paludibacterium yongneupense]
MKPLTPSDLLFQIAIGRFSRRDGLDEFKHRFKFALRSLLTLRSTLKWLAVLCADPRLLALLRVHPRLACKLHRTYLRRDLSLSGKFGVLQQHYALELERFPCTQGAILRGDGELELARIPGKDGQHYLIALTHHHHFDKEGELALTLSDEAGIALVQITLTLLRNSGDGAELWIGGLQGPSHRHGHECIREATKALHGLFPKRVAMEALIALATALGITSVRAGCKSVHIYNSWRYRKSFEADYDAFWEALGGHADGYVAFRLPQPLQRKGMEEIASKKRAEYRRRYALLDDLSTQVALSLA